MSRVTLFLLSLLACACSPNLYLATPPPPNRVASLNQEDDAVELSEGVAVAVECRREGLPCKDVSATSADPRVARVFPAHVAEIDRGWLEQNNISSLALVGVSPGRTTVRVVASGFTTDYTVTVIRAPTTAR